MEQVSRVFVGLDVARARHAVAVAEDGRSGEVRYLGESRATIRRTATGSLSIAKQHGQLHFCYEAGPTGYGIYRPLIALGYKCIVVTPSLIPKRPGDRVQTNRRDAIQLAKLLRAGELTAVWVPDETHEAVRELVRSREAAVDDLRRKRQSISSLMLRHGRAYPGKTTWGARHRQWLQTQRFDHPAEQLVLQEMILAAQHAVERLKRIKAAITQFLPNWTLAPVVDALQALRGVRMVTAATIMVKIGDFDRSTTRAS